MANGDVRESGSELFECLMQGTVALHVNQARKAAAVVLLCFYE